MRGIKANLVAEKIISLCLVEYPETDFDSPKDRLKLAGRAITRARILLDKQIKEIPDDKSSITA